MLSSAEEYTTEVAISRKCLDKNVLVLLSKLRRGWCTKCGVVSGEENKGSETNEDADEPDHFMILMLAQSDLISSLVLCFHLFGLQLQR